MSDHPVTPTGRTEDAPHDVLAADEFGVPGEDPRLRTGPVTLPDDPSGIVEPHDVLAAEEFAMPAGHGDDPGSLGATRGRSRWVLVGVVAGLVVALLWQKRR